MPCPSSSHATTISVLIVITVAAGGCATDARRIDPTGRETITTVDQINIQDWMEAGRQMTDSLFASGRLARYSSEDPAVLAISRIVNDTTQRVNTDLLTRQIRSSLSQSGKVVTTTTLGLSGPEDPLARRQGEVEQFLRDSEGRPTEGERPDYSLSGQLIEVGARAGRTKQKTFEFQLALTDIDRGVAVWEDVVRITKQGTRPAVGW